jgi:hypothetical protein
MKDRVDKSMGIVMSNLHCWIFDLNQSYRDLKVRGNSILRVVPEWSIVRIHNFCSEDDKGSTNPRSWYLVDQFRNEPQVSFSKTSFVIFLLRSHSWFPYSCVDVKGVFISSSTKIYTLVVVYYESIKWELKRRPIYECLCDKRLKTKSEGSTRLTYTGLFWGLEHLKIDTRLIDERLWVWWVSVWFRCDRFPV